MKLTAPVAISDRPVSKDRLEDWANDEVIPLLKQIRQALNAQLRERPTSVVTAGGGAYTRLWTSDAMPTNAAWWVAADISAVSTSGAFQAAGYLLTGLFRSSAGVVAAVGVPGPVVQSESAVLIDARFGVDAGNRKVYLEGRDDAASPMRFVTLVRLLEATP